VAHASVQDAVLIAPSEKPGLEARQKLFAAHAELLQLMTNFMYM